MNPLGFADEEREVDGGRGPRRQFGDFFDREPGEQERDGFFDGATLDASTDTPCDERAGDTVGFVRRDRSERLDDLMGGDALAQRRVGIDLEVPTEGCRAARGVEGRTIVPCSQGTTQQGEGLQCPEDGPWVRLLGAHPSLERSRQREEVGISISVDPIGVSGDDFELTQELGNGIDEGTNLYIEGNGDTRPIDPTQQSGFPFGFANGTQPYPQGDGTLVVEFVGPGEEYMDRILWWRRFCAVGWERPAQGFERMGGTSRRICTRQGGIGHGARGIVREASQDA